MGMVRRRTVFEQPVTVLYSFRYILVGALCLLPWAAVTSSQDVTSSRQQGGERGGLQPHHLHHRPLCPDGWVRGSTGGQSFKDKDAGLCLHLAPQALGWREARAACRAKDSVLLSLDTVLSVEDKLFPQYLKDKGVGQVWTGMHKNGGRQIWDEPGKGMVKAYRGSQQSLGEATRGWTWDTATFSDAKHTCGLFAYSSDQPHSAQRRRRDADTPSPGALSRSSSDTPGREDSLHSLLKAPAVSMDTLKSFFSSEGLKTFSEKVLQKHTGSSAKAKTVAPEKKDGSTSAPKQTPLGLIHDVLSDKLKDSDKKSDPSSDKHGSGVKDKEKNDSPSDDKNGVEKPSNSTDQASSDEEDNNHELTKRSTPKGHFLTTPNPVDSNNNVTRADNSTQQVTTPSTNQTAENTTAPASVSEDSSSSQQNDTSSAGMFEPSGGFSREIMDFFNTDSKDAGSASAQPAPVPKTDPPASRDTAPRDTPPRESVPAPLSPQDFVHRFAKKPRGSVDSAANGTKAPSSTAAALSSSVQPSAAQPSTSTKDTLSPQSGASQNVAANRTAQAEASSAAGSTKSAPAATTTEERLSQAGTHQPMTQTNVQPHREVPGHAAAPVTPSPSPRSTTPDSSSEEVTDSSQTTTASTPSHGNTQGLFSDSLPASGSSTTFQQHFGPSSSSDAPNARPKPPDSNSTELTKDRSSEESTTPSATTRKAHISDDLFQNVVTLTLPSYLRVTTARSADSGESTPRPDSAEVTGKTDSAEVTSAPDSQEASPKPDSQEKTASLKPDSQEKTASPRDSQEVTLSSMKTTQPAPTTASHSTARQRDSSEEQGHVTSASAAPTSGVASSSGGSTTLSQIRGILESMTPRPSHLLPSAGRSWMTLHPCQQRQQFVCAAKPVHDFTPMTQCGDGWLGHSLVSRCYRLVSEPAPYEQAQRLCRSLGGELASADTAFFANVTHILLDRLSLLHGFASRVWIQTSPSGNEGGACRVMEPQVTALQSRPCHLPLPFFCQRPAAATPPDASSSSDDDDQPDLDRPSTIMNMSSWNTQPLVCPIRPLHHHDTVVWFKDGQPIPSYSDDGSSPGLRSTNSRNSAVLHLNIHLLQRLGITQRRMQQPALLQGVYWCRVWRHHPLRSVTSDPVFVRFLDVVTLQGFIKTSAISVAEAVFFNEMQDNTGLPAAIGRGLQLMNDRIYPGMQRSQPFLSDVITLIQNANADTDEVEFRTYLCLSTGAMAPQDKGAVVDGYLKALHTELVASEDLVRRDWNLSASFEQAFRLLMTEMCPESRLVDKGTGYEATFPSTPVNQHAVSLDSCDGMFTGYAVCRGDLQSGAYWSHWSVDMTCYDADRTDTTDSEPKDKGQKPKINPEDVVDTGHGFVLPSKPNSDLLDIDEVHIEQENVEDVTDRLADILDTSEDLTDVDVEIVADVIDRVSLVPILPQDVGLTLLKTVDRVLDSPLRTLQVAQQRTQASTRILKDLDKFSEKLDFGHKGHVRYVTPNIAMEVWDTRTAREPVIGLAATVGEQVDSPLSETRILTLSNRTWADLHLSHLQVAIELPDQLVSAEGAGEGRLSMAIFRKPGLFLSSLPVQPDSSEDLQEPDLNSVIISATLASTSVANLKDRVKLIFRPMKSAQGRPTRCVYWDFNLPSGGGWSSQGCVYNGTQMGRDICLCDHLTNFAVLLDFYGDSRPVDEVNTTALSVITIIGLSLSILGLALTVISFLFFKKLRQGRAQQTLFHMSIALLCSEVILLVGLKQTTSYGLCLAVAILLHYFILASFFWMLVEAVLQYLTFVKVLGTYISKYTLKTVLPAWTVPLIPVIAVLATDYRQYRGRADYCWMNLDAFYYAFALPVGIIILFNVVTFIVIMISLLRRPEGLRSTRNKANTAETNIRAAFTIFILLGLTWTFGYLAIADARLPFQYMFTVFSSLQGFFIFVMLVARRRQFREQWRALCCGRIGQARGQKITPTLSNSASSQSSTSSFTSSSRSRTSSGGSSKTLDILIKRADSNASRTKVQLSSKASNASTRSRQC